MMRAGRFGGSTRLQGRTATGGRWGGKRGPGGGVLIEVAVLTLVEDGLEEVSPFYTFSSTAAGTLRWDFHTSATPPAAGSGDLGTGTQSVSSGSTVFSVDLSPYPGTGYLHFRVTNSAGTSNILTSQVITVGWSPLDLGADLLAWYDASDSGSITGSAPVTQWNDKSGNGNHLTSASDGPTYSATALGSAEPGMTFASTKKLADASFGGTSGSVLVAFGVAQLDSGGPSYGRMVSYAPIGTYDFNATDYTALVLADGGSAGVTSYRNSSAAPGKAVTYGTPFRFVSVWSAGDYTMYVNNSAGSTTGYSLGNFSNSVGLTLGNVPFTGDDYWKGVISELVICKIAPDSTLRTTIDDYLSAKWTST